MKITNIKKAKSLNGEIVAPPDKSISHRAAMLASIADGKSNIKNFLNAEDPLSTMNAMRALGVEIIIEDRGQGIEDSRKSPTLIINGRGLFGLKEPFDVINCGNSGTTARLISGILAGNGFFSVLTGDDSLKKRPMARVINPLKEMGAKIYARQDDRYLPMAIKGGRLKGITYNMPVASAQVKSCLILAGLYSEGTTIIHEPQKSRDHTERMLMSMGASVEIEGLQIKVRGLQPSAFSLQPIDITIPSDFSSAAFFIVGALIVPNSEILIKNVVLNPARTGLLEIIKGMGGEVRIDNIRDAFGEPVGDIYVRTADNLKGIKIGKEIMPSMIDEFPILCVLASQADGITEIRGAEELRVKESDRISAMASELRKMGVELEEFSDGIAIKGRVFLRGADVETYHDHRIAMSLAIASLVAEGQTTINNSGCVDISYPAFFEELNRVAS